VVLIRKSRGIDDDGQVAMAGNNGVLGFLPERTCAICFSESSPEDVLNNPGGVGAGAAAGVGTNDVTNPYEAVECGHVYCYVCIASKIELEEGEGWTCLRCNTLVKRCRPWRAGVVGLTSFDEKSEGSVTEGGLMSPKDDHGLEDIIEQVDDDEEEEDPLNEEPAPVVFAGGDYDDEESDGTRTEKGGDDAGYYMKGVEEDESNYNTADDGDDDQVRPWER